MSDQPQQTNRRIQADGIQAQADELLRRMTPAEKAGQLTQYFYFRLPAGAATEPALGMDPDAQPHAVEEALGRGAVGSLLFVTDPAEINRLQRQAIEGNRHAIPVLFGFDVIHGLRTILPVPIAMAASWDPETIERGQAVAAREARAAELLAQKERSRLAHPTARSVRAAAVHAAAPQVPADDPVQPAQPPRAPTVRQVVP